MLSLGAALPAVYGVKQLAEGDPAAAAGGVTAGLVVAILFVRRQRGLDAPLVDIRLFGNRRFRGALIVMLGGLAAIAGSYLFVSLYFQRELGLSPLRAALWLVPSALAMLLTSGLTPTLARRIPVHRLIALALLVSAAGSAVLTQVGSALVASAGLVVVYLGQGPIMALGTDLVVSAAPPERAGAASALSETSSEFGLALGVAVLGSVGLLVERFHGFTDGLAVVALIGAVTYLGLALLAVRSIRPVS